MSLALELVALLAVFAAVTVAALALGAANLGTAATFGLIAFLGAVMWMMLRR